MKKKLIKVLEFFAVILSLVLAVFVATHLSIESILRKNEEPVTLAMTEGGLPEDYIGKPAAEDIPRITDAATWQDTWATSYVTIEPIDIIPTGIGSRHPWIDAYTTRTRRSPSRKRPDVNSMSFDLLDEYGEYHIIQLPDQSYILAQMSKDDARKLKAGKEITLPVGRKDGVHRQALPRISELCDKYNVDTEGVFYCINDSWNEGHQLMVQIIRLAVGFLVTLVFGTILILIIDKIFKAKES